MHVPRRRFPAEQTTQQQFVQYYRRLPNLILRQALDGANSLRYLGDDQFNGRKHNVVTFVMPDTQQVALYVDARTGLVSKYELVFTDPLRGQEASEIMFSDYASAGKLKVPQTWTWRLAGDVVARYKVKAQFNGERYGQESSRWPMPDSAKFPRYRSRLKPSVEKLADGVYVIHNVAGQNQNTMAVEFKDYVVRGRSAGHQRRRRQRHQTHQGDDSRQADPLHRGHASSRRPHWRPAQLHRRGRDRVTTRDNRKVVETMAAAPQNDRLAQESAQA